MIEIKRDAYLQQLTMRKDNGMIKVITGIRRCGKSFLLFNISRDIYKRMVLIPIILLRLPWMVLRMRELKRSQAVL